MEALHFLMTYRCTRQCPHCFVWATPLSWGSMDPSFLLDLMEAAPYLGLSKVALEGGEPFLRYHLCLNAAGRASDLGVSSVAVTNAFWAFSEARAEALLAPLAEAGMKSLMISSDDFHGGSVERRRADTAQQIARRLGIDAFIAETKLDDVMFRGRAARALAPRMPGKNPEEMTECPFEELARPARVHVDAWGYVHLCQGLAMGQVEGRHSLVKLVEEYSPENHPVAYYLLEGGPWSLTRAYGLTPRGTFADNCHLCYWARDALRDRFPRLLGPGPAYGLTDPLLFS